MKTAVNILYENGICLLELNDEFNTSILKSMEEYKDQELTSLRSELAEKEKEIANLIDEVQELKAIILYNPPVSERNNVIEEIEKQIGSHDYTVDGDYNVIRVQTLREYLKELKNTKP